MSLKKQVKEMKTEMQKKDEELENLRKNIKNTKVSEIDIEIKTYKDECLRLRHLIDDLMTNQNHPIYNQ
jgi:hypothetical protein